MSNTNRKRKYEKKDIEVEVIVPKNKFKTLSVREIELERALANNIDSGIGETDSDDSDKNKCPAWVDEDDDDIDVGIALDSQNRRLPKGGVNKRSNQYQNLLKHKFETIIGKPKWASLDKKEYNSDSDDDILQHSGFLGKRIKSELPESTLEYKKVKDLNCELHVEGSYVNVIEFHPSSSVSLVAGSTGISTLFAVDGNKNNKIHSVAFQKYPIYCAKFINCGNDVVLGSRYNYMYNYDLLTTTATKIILPHDLTQCKYFVVSPDGKYLAVAGKFGEIHILLANTKERIALLKQDSNASSLCFNPDGNLLYAHSTTGEITIFDMNMRRAKHIWNDDGCIHGTTVAISNSNQFVASGSAEGVVNIYEISEVMLSRTPTPKKTLLNLTTSINDLKFNSTSEVLAFSSMDIESSARLCHMGSLSVFNNFPSFGSKLGHISVINFSPGSGYFAIGNRTVSLYKLKHYANY